jgi:hypothetical protein
MQIIELDRILTAIDRDAIVAALADLDLGAFFGKIGREEVLEVIVP